MPHAQCPMPHAQCPMPNTPLNLVWLTAPGLDSLYEKKFYKVKISKESDKNGSFNLRRNFCSVRKCKFTRSHGSFG
ncbi:hypothetical protein H6G33_21975 [Calothrix sp. FACHB-1219]|uniref:hypothetical protein n=1 Tax=unclassified Calothrix TaxID=2619626 RepID=UPI001682C0D3|nr:MULTISPECIES: hypothetical protein [unclassified Calothrix]MBD2206699.1 hypothetical protein [Calothrix sp. FACHB-168]MBD2219689.1 hypothetical protein [Calothrix sp. FACHB-1219]